MKNSFLKSTIFLLLFAVLTNCSTNSRKKELIKIDSLKTVIVQLKKDLEKLDTHKVAMRHQMFVFNMEQINPKIAKVKDSAIINLFNSYEPFERTYFLSFPKKLIKLSQQLDFSIKQLDSLHYDVTNGLIPKSKYLIYFKNEAANVNLLKDDVPLFINYMDKYKSLFDSLNPKIVEIRIKLTGK